MKYNYRNNITKQIHYDSYLQYHNLKNKLAISPMTLLVVDKAQTILIFETPEKQSELLFSLNVGNEKIVDYCFKTSPIKPIAIDYALLIIEKELGNITDSYPSIDKLICQNEIVDQIATICRIEPGDLRLLPLNKLEELFNNWMNNSSNNVISENSVYNNEIIIATLLLLKEIMHYLKCDAIYIIK